MNIINYEIIICFLLLIAINNKIIAQSDVNIAVNVKHKVGDVSTFDREKYMVMHSTLSDNDWKESEDKLKYLLNDLDVYLGRDNGGICWSMNQADQDPLRPGYADPAYASRQGQYTRETVWGQNTTVRHQFDDRLDLVIGGQYNPFWLGKSTNPCCGKVGWPIANADASGDWMGMYLKEFFRNEGDAVSKGMKRPKFLEVINEPLYSLIDDTTIPEDERSTPSEVFQFHNDVAAGVRKVFPDVMIGGFTVAFPYFDEQGFTNWDERMKLFYDMSGEEMDFFSIHLYDFNKHHYNNGSAFHGPIYYRGGRIEATLDMMEQYSMMKWDFVKPVMITEYGGRDHSIEWKDWTPERDWHFMKSMSPMMLQFMDRPNHILKAIPFIMTKATYHTGNAAYPWRMLRQAKEAPNESGEDWVFTELIKFYELWSDVNGTRVAVKSANSDVLTDAYVDGNKAYVIASNIDLEDQEINLNIFERTNNTIESISVKHLHLVGNAPELSESILTADANATFVLDAEATAIFEYTFTNNVEVEELEEEVKYYADDYKKLIEADKALHFNIDGLSLEADKSYTSGQLRIGIGRDHTGEKLPQVSFNGVNLTPSSNYSGDDQALRNQFFGMLDVKIPGDILQENNVVEILYPDGGGYVSTVTLKVFTSTVDMSDVGVKKLFANEDLKIYPNPTSGTFTIELLQETNNAQVTVFDMRGQIVYSGSMWKSQKNIKIENGKGIYLVSIDSDTKTIKGKVIIN
ncbi:T9SS type A sorting domain-containing protein [Saccharicrinis aurantiacus]|uniref:T9SS type A sorting domain-containing protein n=1 Tax=Saccharicrinis aurantiacus TaxID=1849719 RepID=UPI00094F96F9|nr:T9SS type A sorting domain-containing protein [Saccharicrinis aurantiacus]